MSSGASITNKDKDFMLISSMNMQQDFILIKKFDDEIESDFYISKYPVTRKDYQELFGLNINNIDNDKSLHKTTWLEAIRYCNVLSTKNNLYRPYCEETGKLIDSDGIPTKKTTSVKGFRLPTLKEWEYAAKGWSEIKTGCYFNIQKKYYRVPFLDYPTTEEEIELFKNGYSNINEMVMNTIGIYGMLVYAREWYSDCDEIYGIKNKMCCWEEYIVNYNNDIGYQVRNKFCEDTDEYSFRIVINKNDITKN